LGGKFLVFIKGVKGDKQGNENWGNDQLIERHSQGNCNEWIVEFNKSIKKKVPKTVERSRNTETPKGQPPGPIPVNHTPGALFDSLLGN
jgi:hypothetical protein